MRVQDQDKRKRSLKFSPADFLQKVWDYTSVEARCFSISLQREKWINKFFCIDTLFTEKEKKKILREFKERSDYEVTFIETRDDIVPSVIESMSKKSNVYYNPLPFTAPPRVNGNVRVALSLFADLDFKREIKNPDRETAEKAEDKFCAKGVNHALECYYLDGEKVMYVKRPSLKNIIERIRRLGVEPSIVVDSGNGYHLLLLLEYEVSVMRFKELESLYLKALKKIGIKADEEVKNPSRVLRLPGSVNLRNNRVTSVIFESETKYNPAVLERMFGKVAVNETGRKKERYNKSKKFYRLSKGDIATIERLLDPYYEVGNRHNLTLWLAGWGAQEKIHPLDISEIIWRLYLKKGDNESKDRILAILYSYAKAGIDIRRYKERIIEQWGIDDINFDGDPANEIVKGKSGVADIIKNMLEERGWKEEEARKRAIQVIQQIQSLFDSKKRYFRT